MFYHGAVLSAPKCIHCQLDRIQSHLEGKPLEVQSEFLDWANLGGDPSWTWVAPSHGWGLGLSKKEKVSWAPMSILLLPDRRCNVTSCLEFLLHGTPPWQTVSTQYEPRQPFLPLLLPGVCHSNKNSSRHCWTPQSSILWDLHEHLLTTHGHLTLLQGHAVQNSNRRGDSPRSSIPGLCLPSWNAHSTQNTAGWKGFDLVAFQQLKIRASQVYSIWKRSKL